jgi:hypothetical protein
VTAAALKSPLAPLRWVLTSSVARVMGSGLGFVATFLVTRALGPAQSGILFATITWALALAILARWGANDRILIELAPLKGGWRQSAIAAFVNREIRASMIRAAMLLGAVLAGLWAMDEPPALDIALLVALVPATVLLQLVSAACKGMRRLTTAFAFEIVFQPLVVIAAVLAVMASRASQPFGIIAGSYLVATLAGTAGCLMVGMRGQWHGRLLTVDKADGRRRARDFGLIEITNYAATALPMLMLPFLLPPADVGILNLAFRIVASIGLLSSTVHLLTLPALSIARHRRDPQAWAHTIRRGRLLMAAVAGLFLLGVLTAGPFALRLAGEGFGVGQPCAPLPGIRRGPHDARFHRHARMVARSTLARGLPAPARPPSRPGRRAVCRQCLPKAAWQGCERHDLMASRWQSGRPRSRSDAIAPLAATLLVSALFALPANASQPWAYTLAVLALAGSYLLVFFRDIQPVLRQRAYLAFAALVAGYALLSRLGMLRVDDRLFADARILPQAAGLLFLLITAPVFAHAARAIFVPVPRWSALAVIFASAACSGLFLQAETTSVQDSGVYGVLSHGLMLQFIYFLAALAIPSRTGRFLFLLAPTPFLLASSNIGIQLTLAASVLAPRPRLIVPLLGGLLIASTLLVAYPAQQHPCQHAWNAHQFAGGGVRVRHGQHQRQPDQLFQRDRRHRVCEIGHRRA